MGKAAAVAPITQSGAFERAPANYYGKSKLDYVTIGVYGFALRPRLGRPLDDAWVIERCDPLYPFVARVNEHPLVGQPFDCMRVADKPFLLYECNDHGPNPWRAEFALRIATILSYQDADACMWFHWDLDSYMPKLDTDAAYATSVLCMPDMAYPNAVLAFGNDEVKVATIKTAGTIFRTTAIPPAEKPAEAVFGQDWLLDPQIKHLEDMEWRLRHYAWREGLVTRFDAVGETKLPPPHPQAKDTFCQTGPYVRFDWTNHWGREIIDAPACKAVCGFYGPDIAIGDTRIENVNRKFSSITFVSQDGKPLGESDSITGTLVCTSENTGVVIDPTRMQRKWAEGAAEATVDRGKAPVINYRVAATVTAPWLAGLRFHKYDFFRRCYASGTVDKAFTVPADEPLFYVRFTRSGPRTFAKMLVMGNSITLHGPNPEKLGWNGQWGMAATAQEKDFAHVLHGLVAQGQGGKAPELVIENLVARNLPGLKQAGRFDQLAAHKADLTIVQIGDNLSPDKANADTLALPYEDLLRTLRKARPDALIVAVGTWGINEPRSDLIRRAAGRQAVPYVELGDLARKAENFAKAEGHFTHDGVNWHPGDAGMKAIAEEIWKAVERER